MILKYLFSLNVKELYEEKKGTMDGMVVFGKICNVKEELDAFLKYGTKLLKPGAPLILYLRDMPYWKGFKCFNSVNFHYAMTYRSDADIYFPYGMVLPKNQTSPLLSSFSWPWKKPHSLGKCTLKVVTLDSIRTWFKYLIMGLHLNSTKMLLMH